MNRNLKLAKHYQKEDGLSDSYINSLTIDLHQNIWVTTGKSLYKLDRTTDTFSEMKIADIPAMEFTRFSGNSISTDGDIYFPETKESFSSTRTRLRSIPIFHPYISPP